MSDIHKFAVLPNFKVECARIWLFDDLQSAVDEGTKLLKVHVGTVQIAEIVTVLSTTVTREGR